MNILRARAGTRILLAAMLCHGLSACSGGSGTSGQTPGAANHAPSITSALVASVVENNAGVIYQASAADSDGDPVTFSLSGTDAARFTISGTGEVRFASPPNFERPTDSDGDNVYSIQLGASDGKAVASQAVTITVTNSKEGVSVERIATGFNHPVAIVTLPGQSQLMVAERSGALYFYDPASGLRTLYATVDGVTNADGQGVLSIAARPDFATRHTVYALVAHGSNIAIRQIYNTTNWAELGIGSHALYANDVGGWLGFGPDGRLYAAIGDSGGTDDPSGSAQGSGSPFGKLVTFSALEFDRYAGASPLPPITTTQLARGLHYPIGGTFYAGGLLLPDRGQSLREEVNALPLTAGTVDNLGWPYREGTSLVTTGEPVGLISPVLEYAHGSGPLMGQQIMGGLVYQGANASLAGTYVFMDASGAIFTVPLTSLQRGSTAAASLFERRDLDFTPASGTITQPVSVAQDATGTIYIACDNGDIFRVTAS